MIFVLNGFLTHHVVKIFVIILMSKYLNIEYLTAMFSKTWSNLMYRGVLDRRRVVT